MIVGITITVDLSDSTYAEHRQSLKALYDKYCVIDDKDVVFDNIVGSGIGVSLFFRHLDEEATSQLEQLSNVIGDLIETVKDKYIIASAVNFAIEIVYRSNVLRLRPTEYVFIDNSDIDQFILFLKQGLVASFPEVPSQEGKAWILEQGMWEDDGVWIDTELWRDDNE